ncbi:hypothetical protein [Xanthocytophaga agilis]|uniref:Uncharacterized protein n=1 Tax=Xanthocytophaga agilis TaxID=3048010 RepID=A0AAE3QY19_9BACT|nr:hypothetical protein [Xanthocytophaga agilis]MDJ1500186.1 hypothetical protein [Xanthocytophaga agilis]
MSNITITIMGVEWIVPVIFFVGFVIWALLFGGYAKGKNGSVTRGPITLHTEGFPSTMDGSLGDKAVSNTTQTEPSGSTVQKNT